MLFELYQKIFPKKKDNDKFEIQNVRRLVSEAKKSIATSYKQKELLELMAHSMNGMVWIKRWDLIQEIHIYEFANYMLCERFFCFTPDCLTDCTAHVKDRTDIDLVSEYREKTGNQHTFGDLCYSTDVHATEQAIIFHNSGGARGSKSCRYFEAGYINGEPVLLDVIKTPLFEKNKKPCWNTHTYSVGTARDASSCCESIMHRGLELIEKKEAMRLSAGVIWVYPKEESCLLVDRELEDYI